MNPQKLCGWLGIPDKAWPPDHYTLLGLLPGTCDVAQIEHHVHDRLAKLRGYQLSHPEEATEGMNRLAQAFLCLSEASARRAYDLSLGGSVQVLDKPPAAEDEKPCTAAAPNGQLSSEETVSDVATETEWRALPPPVRVDEPPPAASRIEPPVPDVASGKALDPVAEAAWSLDARRGLGTLQALCDRIDHTRQLLVAWERAGRYLKKPKRRCSRQAEETDLTRRLEEIDHRLPAFPPILGQPGQPGYRVASMARLEMATAIFNVMDAEQRQALARDWQAGRVVLVSHRRFLRQELKQMRRQGWLGLVLRAIRTGVNDHPWWMLLGVAAVVGILIKVVVFY